MYKRQGLTYRGAGVDVSRAEDALTRVRERIALTKRPEVLGGIGGFGGLFRLGAYRDPVLVATADGVGTKLELARLLGRHEGVGTDLVHHCVNDALAMGADPLFFLDYFSTGRLDPSAYMPGISAVSPPCARATRSSACLRAASTPTDTRSRAPSSRASRGRTGSTSWTS